MKKILSKEPTIGAYITGFVLSLILTLVAFGLTELHISSTHIMITHEVLIPVLLGLALTQMVVQMIFFLHLAHEDNPRWNLIFYIFTFGLVLLVVIASIWIMGHLNYNMSPENKTNYILQDEGVQPENTQMQNMDMNNMPQMQNGDH